MLCACYILPPEIDLLFKPCWCRGLWMWIGPERLLVPHDAQSSGCESDLTGCWFHTYIVMERVALAWNLSSFMLQRCYEHKQYRNGLKFCKQILSNPKFSEHGGKSTLIQHILLYELSTIHLCIGIMWLYISANIQTYLNGWLFNLSNEVWHFHVFSHHSCPWFEQRPWPWRGSPWTV